MPRLVSGKFYWAFNDDELIDIAKFHGPFDTRGDAYRAAMELLFPQPRQTRLPWDVVTFCTGIVHKFLFDRTVQSVFDVRSEQVITHVHQPAEKEQEQCHF